MSSAMNLGFGTTAGHDRRALNGSKFREYRSKFNIDAPPHHVFFSTYLRHPLHLPNMQKPTRS